MVHIADVNDFRTLSHKVCSLTLNICHHLFNERAELETCSETSSRTGPMI